MKQGTFTLTESRPLTDRVRLLRLEGDTSAVLHPGEFVQVLLPGCFLRRPFSVCDRDDTGLCLLTERVGRGTGLLHGLPVGTELELLTGLGNGFDSGAAGNAPLLVGGGTGVSPLLGLGRRLKRMGSSPRVLLGFRTAEEVLLEAEFRALDPELRIFTEDGSAGEQGLVTAALSEPECSFFYACGPEGMLRAVAEACPAPGELAFDVRMGCGFGACMGCSRRTANGMKRVCKDGPVFRKDELVWDD